MSSVSVNRALGALSGSLQTAIFSTVGGPFSLVIPEDGPVYISGVGGGGGGGGGAGNAASPGGGGGGGGASVAHIFCPLYLESGVYSVYIGAGGAAGAAGSAGAGSAGGAGGFSYILNAAGLKVWQSGNGLGGAGGSSTTGGAGGASEIYGAYGASGGAAGTTGAGGTKWSHMDFASGGGGSTGTGAPGSGGYASPLPIRAYPQSTNGGGSGGSGGVSSCNKNDGAATSDSLRGGLGNGSRGVGDVVPANAYGCGGGGGGGDPTLGGAGAVGGTGYVEIYY